MDTQWPADGRLRGRSVALKAVAGLLDSVATGQGGILLVDGAPGIGKTRLLAAAEERATQNGCSLVSAHADEVPRPLPPAPLLSGLDLAPSDGAPANASADQVHSLACLEELAVHTRKLAARGPVVITLDDVQWADTTTITALRELPTWLGTDHPVGWALVRRVGTRQPSTEWLFGEWERQGAARITLGALTDDAVVDIISDVLGAPPDNRLLAMARGAAGNPLLVRAVLDGLRDEGGLAIVGGRARLLSEQPPAQVRDVVHDWLTRISSRARHLLAVAASLDRAFSVDDLADLLGWPDEQVRLPLHEVVAADLLTVVGKDVLGFQHDLVRQSVADGVPAAVRLALHGQAAKSPRPSTALPGAPGNDRRGAEWWDALTRTEWAVAELVAQGLTNREVAARVFLSPHTVSFHLRKVYRKLGIRSRVDLTRAFVHCERERHADDDITAGALA